MRKLRCGSLIARDNRVKIAAMRRAGLGLVTAMAVAALAISVSAAEAKTVVLRLSPKTVHVRGAVTLTVRASRGKTVCGLVYRYKPGRARRKASVTAADGTVTWQLKMGAHNPRTTSLLAIVECSGDPQLRLHYTLLKG
jgi:hypothetical protein